MASLLITKGDEKTNTVVTINGKGVFYQELRLGDRPMSQRVRLGKLVVVDDEIVVDYDAWCEYDALIVERNTVERTKKAAIEVLKTLEDSKAVKLKEVEVKRLEIALTEAERKIKAHPVRSLTVLSAKVMASVEKMLNGVRHKHKHLETTDKTVQFSHHPTKEYFVEKQANELLKRHNESLEARGIEEGYLDFDAAMAVIEKRYSQKTKVSV
ncbi:hypothetical protein LC605_20790 [Nostoc sp. CHAB 5836]|uniref:hypothetical protein n=1 Tax=Nostoc sp. CHAB 5836 TaxID=2780404 RepID=UPI001E47C55B|nr:hypothetical protein [Nostoc sp. CHAB 5836]MCC5617479.1 hypothetical protein [Nostoc sp. CHAB 5836]